MVGTDLYKDKRVLICGDSFATDNNNGWSRLLANDYNVLNLAENGVSQYKIVQQLISVNLLDFDFIIVSHTSPNRVFINNHPVHKKGKTHKNSDLIFTDIEYHLEKMPTDPVLLAAKQYFRYIYDQDYQEYIYKLMQENILSLLQNTKSLHLLTLYDNNVYLFSNYINVFKDFTVQPHNINHLSNQDNERLYKMACEWINNS